MMWPEWSNKWVKPPKDEVYDVTKDPLMFMWANNLFKRREELAWAAGLFDGEGNIHARACGHSSSWSLRIDISQSGDSYVLDRFARAVGIGKVVGPYRQKSLKEHHRSVYKYQLYNFEEVQAVVAMIWPFLSKVKKDQAHAALTAYHAGCTTGPRWKGAQI